jgi:8-oxo-dGTP diphosphatase
MTEGGIMETLIVAAAIIRNNDKFLIAQRLENSHMGLKWEFPGGKIEEGEDAAACLIREIREELDLEIEVGEELMLLEHQYQDRKVILCCHWCRYLRGTAKNLGCQSFKWVSIADLKQYDFSEADLPVVEFLINHI